jgi:hypothetical protein
LSKYIRYLILDSVGHWQNFMQNKISLSLEHQNIVHLKY